MFAQIVINGLTFPLIIAMWFAVLFTGRMPPALYTTYSAALRYQTRFRSWFDMLTSEYAWGMFGDFVPPPPALAAASGRDGRRGGPGPPAAATASRGAAHAGTPAGPAAGAAVLVPVDRRADGDAPRLPGARTGPRPTPGAAAPRAARSSPGPCHRPPRGAHVDPVPGGTAAALGILVLQGAAKGWMIFAVELAVRLFSQHKLAEARDRFVESAKGPASHIADKARSYIQVCERRTAGVETARNLSAEDHFNLGVERLNARDVEQAKAYLGRALTQQPDADHILYTMALCCGLAGDGNGACENLKRAIHLEPRNRILARQDPEFLALASQFPALRSLLEPHFEYAARAEKG